MDPYSSRNNQDNNGRGSFAQRFGAPSAATELDKELEGMKCSIACGEDQIAAGLLKHGAALSLKARPPCIHLYAMHHDMGLTGILEDY